MSRRATAAVFALALVLVASAPVPARASDGYELAFPLAGATLATVALDVTFIVATSVGLTDRDDGWAGVQLAYAIGSVVACGVGAGYAFDAGGGNEGLGGALLLQAAGSIVLAAYALVGLETVPNVEVALAPSPDGFVSSIHLSF